MDCGCLPTIGNGSVSVASSSYQSVATYSCNTGYTLMGDKTRTCTASGVWAGTEPACSINGMRYTILALCFCTYLHHETHSCLFLPDTAVDEGGGQNTCAAGAVGGALGSILVVSIVLNIVLIAVCCSLLCKKTSSKANTVQPSPSDTNNEDRARLEELPQDQ